MEDKIKAAEELVRSFNHNDYEGIGAEEAPVEGAPKKSDDGKSGFTAILAFTDKVTGQAKEDIKDATCFASLYVSSKVKGDIQVWCKEYVRLLNILGLSVQAFESHDYENHTYGRYNNRCIISTPHRR